MEYTVQKLARLAGVSPRTLRYYDQIGLLRPARVASTGYRIYGEEQVNLLQQILFFRELSFSLEEIAAILRDPAFCREEALRAHKARLLERRVQLDTLIRTVEKSLWELEGGFNMQDHEKFEGFKRELIAENERKYGKEIREKYGEDTVEASNAKMMHMSPEDYQAMQALEQEFRTLLQEAKALADPASEKAQQACGLHKQWLGYTWGAYSPEAHMGLGEMYVGDPRFTAYYDADGEGTAAFLRDALRVFTGAEA